MARVVVPRFAARHGAARPGQARQGKAGRGAAWRGKARGSKIQQRRLRKLSRLLGVNPFSLLAFCILTGHITPCRPFWSNPKPLTCFNSYPSEFSQYFSIRANGRSCESCLSFFNFSSAFQDTHNRVPYGFSFLFMLPLNMPVTYRNPTFLQMSYCCLSC